MPTPPTRSRILAARILLGLLFLLVGLQLFAYFRTRYELESPLIPVSIVRSLSRPFLVSAAFLLASGLAAAALLYQRKYRAVLVLCVLVLLLNQVGHQYGLFRSLLGE
ncbi:hypothetical protein [Flaviaesturariibacter aridisoli]|uniref:Uncharacterized protein n=1 Tax=Flaviaesturariibacter aridisoli TaxID=2545761 RepID=A0A4R4E606_9BACT|nr:hypothetical protein [Flaviaesturariibacter aridisoli]TCZ73471.1 hypothetical protein E0486_05795 [Flaviaesturariibacter aridisoli]